jgi:hypothetical protein
MGHERISFLPKTQRWRDIVQEIADLGEIGVDVAGIVQQTTDNIRDRLIAVQRDGALAAAFKFLISLAVASRDPSPHDTLRGLGIDLPNDPSPLALAKSLQGWMAPHLGSLEYARLAQFAATDAIATWYAQKEEKGPNLFSVAQQPLDVWRQSADGAGFCELSRVFFGKFTERYLNYFLEREASAVLPSVEQREAFRDSLHQHVEDVSHHAFETAKITQSFAAGWFNKNAKEAMPSDRAIRGFLGIALGKLREELRREGKR